MAKDPAFLFYPNDFDAKTKFLTDEQVGKYLRLLIAEFQHGRLNEKQVLHICKTYDEDIMRKFQRDENGLYFNDRLEFEINKRKTYSESRSKNRKKNKEDIKNISASYVKHMENENENRNVNKDKTNNYQNLELTEMQINKTVEFLTITKQVKATKEMIIQLWDIFKVKEYDENKPPKNEKDMYRHFLNTLRYEKIEQHKTSPNAIRDDSKARKILGL